MIGGRSGEKIVGVLCVRRALKWFYSGRFAARCKGGGYWRGATGLEGLHSGWFRPRGCPDLGVAGRVGVHRVCGRAGWPR